MQWRTWGACFIQAAWRRYRRKKAQRTLREAEERLHALENEEQTSPSFVSTMYAQRFASNALRPLRSGKHSRMPLKTQNCKERLPLLPPKPAEPDFTTQKN